MGAMVCESRHRSVVESILDEKEMNEALRVLKSVLYSGEAADEVAMPPPEPKELRDVTAVSPELEPMKVTGSEQGLENNDSMGAQLGHMLLPFHLPHHNSQGCDGLKRTPIIVVPTEFKSMVTLHNVKILLEEGRFVPPSVMRFEIRGSEKWLPEEVMIYHISGGKEQKYRVIDSVANLAI